jgi:Protein of unknown function (DUF3102)
MSSTAASASFITPYAYDALPDQGQATRLKAAAKRIRDLFRGGVVEVGRELIAVKEEIGHGSFCRWITAEFAMTERTAQNYMAAATLAQEKSETVSYLPATILYRLGSTSPKARGEVMKRLERGEQLSSKQVGVVIRAVRDDERIEARKEDQKLKRRQRPKKQEDIALAREKMAQAAAEAAAALDEVVGILRQCLPPEDAQRILRLAQIIEKDHYRVCSLISVARTVAGSPGDASRNGAEQAVFS